MWTKKTTAEYLLYAITTNFTVTAPFAAIMRLYREINACYFRLITLQQLTVELPRYEAVLPR